MYIIALVLDTMSGADEGNYSPGVKDGWYRSRKSDGKPIVLGSPYL